MLFVDLVGKRKCAASESGGTGRRRGLTMGESTMSNHYAGDRVHIARRCAVLLLTVATVLATLAVSVSPVKAQNDGPVRVKGGLGFFYGTFNEDPNIAMLVGGTAEEFCEASPEDPFGGEPGSATQRIFEGDDGSVMIKVNSKRQPFHLYEVDFPEAPPWIEAVCAAYFDGESVPESFASGTARVKSRVHVGADGVVDIFNRAVGKATGGDGTSYKVRGSADFIVDADGELSDEPENFVKFTMRKIRS